MSQATFNRALSHGVILSAVVVAVIGTSAGVPIYSEATGSSAINIPPAGIFATSVENQPSVPGGYVHEQVEAVVAESVKYRTEMEAAKSSYETGRAVTPSDSMTKTEGAFAEALNGFDIPGLEAGTDAFLSAHADLLRAQSTATSTTVSLHVPAGEAKTYVAGIQASVEDWRTSVSGAFESWKTAVAEENARIVEEERLRAEAEARRQAELEAQRQAEARAVAQAAAQRAAAAAAVAPAHGSSAPVSVAPQRPAAVAPVAQPAGETPAQRVNRLQARLGINVSYVFAACDTPRALGCYLPGQASFRITTLGLSKNDRNLCGTILHEYRHIQQHQQGLIQYTSDGGYANAPWLESDANAYMNSRNTC